MPKRAGNKETAATIRFNPDDVAGTAEVKRQQAALLVVQGAELDLGRHVVCDKPIVIGRDPDVELPLRDGSISRHHCRVELDAATKRHVLVDLGSTNGTRVNTARVDRPVPLTEGDKIFLGATVVKFAYADQFDVEYQARVDNLVATDALTGLWSKRHFDSAFALAAQKARRDGEPLAVLVMDMDGLKKINDTQGHDMGGFVIAEVAAIIKRIIDNAGETSRFGGDEFMSFLVGADKGAAAAHAERIRQEVERHDFNQGEVRLRTTISIGVAALPDDGESPEELFRAADRALYRAKGAGKNRVSS